jgi:16S rRNA (guanine966-N2)-methyltransferase
MRVIAGSAGSLRLVTPEGSDTRPTADRIKETLFNMLQAEIPGSTVVDLFAGSGSLGIEALSRGAKRAYLVENDAAAFRCIQENVRFTKLEEKAVLLKQDVLGALDSIHEKEVDVIFIDPPYHKGYEKKVLQLLVQQAYVGEDTLIVLEAVKQADGADFLPPELEIEKEKIYKTNKHLFLRRK